MKKVYRFLALCALGFITPLISFADVPEGFVVVKGATVTGQIKDSAIFISKREVIVRDILVCDHEVTQKEFEQYCEYNRALPDANGGKGDNYPVYNVTWQDAIMYCNRRSVAEGLTPCYIMRHTKDTDKWGKPPTLGELNKYKEFPWMVVTCDFDANGYRLPTEIEWEYCARGGNGLKGEQTPYSGSKDIKEVAWYNKNSDATSHEVKQKAPNSLGLYDMSGNVAEWCFDLSGGVNRETPLYGPEFNPTKNGLLHAYRGGSWLDEAEDLNVSKRGALSIAYSFSRLGFRVVRTITN